MTIRAGLIGLALALAVPALAEDAGLQTDVTFSDYPAPAKSSELLARVFTPLTVAQIRRELAQSGKALSETSVDLSSEKFLLYVPAQKPAGGYGLMVFVPPWQRAQLPKGWGPVMDQFGMIFVSAARSGNSEDIVSRREPLAVSAALNVMARYPVDPSKVLIGGMSGGARIALRLALAYPDIFKGAFLNSGSDPIGTKYEPLPSPALFRQFQTDSRILYVTGTDDSANIESEGLSLHSLQDWCVSDTASQRMSFTGHEVAPAPVLTRGLTALLAPARPDPARLADCRAQLEADIAAKLSAVDDLVAAGKREAARDRLKDIDARYGGLAAPHSVALDAALAQP